MKKTKKLAMLVAGFMLLSSGGLTAQQATERLALKAAFADKFAIGTALNLNQIYEKDSKAKALIESQFNTITAENCMKAMYLQPREGEFNFKDADRFVEYGEKHGMRLIGHTLIWHSQAPGWFFKDKEGKEVSKEVLIERMRKHIHTVLSRYKGRIKGWDVVNEAILDNGEWRQSKFYQIIGEDFVRLAFQFAHEADPDAELYYNDYSMFLEGRRKGVVSMVRKLQEKGGKIDGIGMQGHLNIDYPALSDFENSLLAFSALGVKVMITEMEISVLPAPKQTRGAEVSTRFTYNKQLDPYAKGLPKDKELLLGQRYKDFFALFLKHRDKIDRVTVWGVTDGDSWKNNWPVPGRRDYPLLFDRNYRPKSFVADIIDIATK
ncbi:endo-1,4-beta-xylanase [Sphingobacterium prati]|uniref:endo-1,4-beta-xylanase n=1 Tax=Sphingobacterium prati TaxID=2737006 RepID=UPI001FE80669|nr:endo-1,4-beta-xylanase [Sphingobacterium prati]